ncbi:piggyBac transposable element-derived protein 3-like [Macrobrachium nipponense]|uniref:piggyBac transposable element-derived protein 3-like n=1 Tax=Macrobrachium nipponense TaxID=159736 RepID=UPI0030C7D032
MSVLKMPRIRMYWQGMTRLPFIADAMPRDRFFKLRSALKFVDDNKISAAQRSLDRVWKVRPLLEEIRKRCNELPREKKLSIDESIIPFRGRLNIKQHVPGKPNPDGLKMFVLASTKGLVYDFEIFQGKEALISLVDQLNAKPNRPVTLGEAVVFRFLPSVEPGSSLFFDRYFTSPQLLGDLYDRCLRGTGTLKKNMLPKEANLKSEATLKREGRGASDSQVRYDRKVALTAWYDKKVIYMASNEFGIKEEDVCLRWSKAKNEHIQVQRPCVVREYNKAMGGVDLHDQVVSYYRSSSRTKKWTVRTGLHMMDVTTANSWLEYRADCGENKYMPYLDFKLQLANQLMRGELSDRDGRRLGSTDSDEELGDPAPKTKRGKFKVPFAW